MSKQEYMLKGKSLDRILVKLNDLSQLLLPNHPPSKRLSLNDYYDFEIGKGKRVGFSAEMGFMHVFFEEDKFSDSESEQIINTIRENLNKLSGENYKTVRIT